MEPVIIRRVTFAEIASAPNFEALAAEYRAESANTDLVGRPPDVASYTAMERSGVAYCLGAYRGGELAGFACVLITPVPHFAGRLIATTESVFVSAAHRAGGAGLALLHAMEAMAREHGAAGLYVSSPSRGRLSIVLPRTGYHETNRVYYRSLQA